MRVIRDGDGDGCDSELWRGSGAGFAEPSCSGPARLVVGAHNLWGLENYELRNFVRGSKIRDIIS